MSGRRLVIGLLGVTALFAAALIWFQFFAFYARVSDVDSLRIAGAAVPVTDYDGIDADASPLKLRGCLRIDPAALAGLDPAPEATPLTPPPWFRCFDARGLSEAIAAGAARAYRIAADAPEGFDLYLAVYPDGRGYLWRQLNARFTD